MQIPQMIGERRMLDCTEFLFLLVWFTPSFIVSFMFFTVTFVVHKLKRCLPHAHRKERQ